MFFRIHLNPRPVCVWGGGSTQASPFPHSKVRGTSTTSLPDAMRRTRTSIMSSALHGTPTKNIDRNTYSAVKRPQQQYCCSSSSSYVAVRSRTTCPDRS